MSDEPLTNAVTERMRRAYDFSNERSEAPSIAFTDDFIFFDRRKGGANLGEGDASYFRRTFEQFWMVGGRPHFSMVEVIAARGEWCAACVEKVVFGDSGMYLEHINVMAGHPLRESWRRFAFFDPDDVDAAIAELDRMYAEVDTEPETPS